MPRQPDSWDQLRSDIAADPETRAALQEVLEKEAEDFLRSCVKFAKKMCLMEDAWQGRRILTQAALWMIEANQSADKELAVAQSPKATTEAFRH